jgi:hypothetical protein
VCVCVCVYECLVCSVYGVYMLCGGGVGVVSGGMFVCVVCVYVCVCGVCVVCVVCFMLKSDCL